MKKNDYLFRCAQCGTRNKIPGEKIGIHATCGKCKAVMNTIELSEDKPVMVTDANFHVTVEKSPLPVLLDCWAPWCGPCKMMGPVFDELAREWKGKIRVCKINVDENPIIASRFQVQSIPAIVILDRGIQKDLMIGALPKQQIMAKMAAYL